MTHEVRNMESVQGITSVLAKTPLLSFYVRTRGEAFVLSWFHRVAGIGLVLFLWLHLLTSFMTPVLFTSTVALLVAAIVLIYHSFNGGRLILFEVFGARNDESLIHWVWGLSLFYILLVALLIAAGNQGVSQIFFWSVIWVSSLILCFGAASRIWRTEHALGWKLQRISGAFLLMMVPAHIVIMNLSVPAGADAQGAVVRLQDILARLVQVTLVVGVLYHGGYGLVSIIRDYVSSRGVRFGAALLITVLMAFCAVYRFI